MSIIDNIKLEMKKRGLSAATLCKGTGIRESNFSDWKNERAKPSIEAVQKIANYLNISVDYLLNGKSNIINLPTSKRIKIPVLGYVRAGVPVEAMEEILDYEEITQEMSEHGEHFALKIKGNSMEPRICEGDVVIVRKQCNVESGEIAIIIVNGGDATVKKVMKNSNGIVLVPFNMASFQPIMYSNEEINDLPVSVIGKVVELRGKF